MIVEERAGGVCTYVSVDQVAQVILRYVTDKVMSAEYAWTWRQAVEAARFWHGYTRPKPRPAPLLWSDEPGLCYHRLPWTRDGASAPTPLWDELLARMSNAQAFRLWVGSLFDPKADLQQYVWLYGQGMNGKGAITRFLELALGPSFSSQQPPGKDDKFWTYGLRSKRLVVFPDCNNTTFVTTGLFKALTGGDAIRLEGKGKDATSARLACKFLFASNERPALSSEKADMRRPIYCELGAISSEPDPGYEAKLWAEGGAFLRQCVEAYAAACPHGGPVPDVQRDEIEGLAATEEEELEVAFNSAFTVHHRDEGVRDCDVPYVTPEEFQRVMRDWFGGDRRKEKEFRAWAERRHGLKRLLVRSALGRDWRYVGVSMRPHH